MLIAEQLLDAICAMTALPEAFAGLPAGTKATELPTPDIAKHEFLKIFGQPERQTVCACERTSDSNLGMAIQFFNGELVYNKLKHESNRFRQLAAAEKSDAEIVGQLHLAAVSRAPTEKELLASLDHLAAKEKERQEETSRAEAEMAALQQQAEQVRTAVRDKLLDGKLAALPEPIRADTKAAVLAPADGRNEVQRYLAEKFGALAAVSEEEVAAALTSSAGEMRT